MAEALWVQAVGVDYSAAEDRRLIAAMYTGGVVDGLAIVDLNSSTQISVTAGRAIIADGAGGAYLAYFDSATTKTLPASATTNVFVVVDPTTALATIATGSTPTNPHITLGNGVTDGSSVTAVASTATQAEDVTVNGRYLKLAGGTMVGGITVPNTQATGFLVPSIFQANSAGVNAPNGVRLGGSYPTARHYCRAYLTADQSIPSSGWHKLLPGGLQRSATDYTIPPYAQQLATGAVVSSATYRGRFYAGVSGEYQLDGVGWYSDPSGTNVGQRRASIARYTAAGVLDWRQECMNINAIADNSSAAEPKPLRWSAMMDAPAGYFFQFEMAHNQGTALTIDAGSYSSGTRGTFSMRLIQAD